MALELRETCEFFDGLNFSLASWHINAKAGDAFIKI